MLYYGKNEPTTGQLNDRLKTTAMALGLVRLQLDVGLKEEAQSTLSTLQDDIQLLLHATKEMAEKNEVGADRWLQKSFIPAVQKNGSEELGVAVFDI